MQKQIAIIIPAFTADFLKEALESIEKQTDKRFQVYIGDDESPDDLWSITKQFSQKNGWIYHRFDQNLGKSNLVAHWNRCVELSSEPWIWLFSDDDVMSEDCISTFYSNQSQFPQQQIFRFSFSIIDQNSQVKASPSDNWYELSGFDFGRLRFERKILSSAVEFIFTRKAYNDNNGFIEFPSAWCSDDASWIAFAESGSIRKFDKGNVFWRLSGTNISSQAGPYIKIKLKAALAFIVWFNRRFQAEINSTLLGEQIIWFRLQIEQVGVEFSFWKGVEYTQKTNPNGLFSWLRTFNEIYLRALLNVKYNHKGKKAPWLLKWVSQQLPKY